MYGVLNVYLLNRFVGRFSHESVGDIYAFQYDPEYLANPAEGALSHSLPLQSDVFESEVAYGYFANLLPPAYIRKKLEKCVHISAGNVFGFLRALGGDCAGAERPCIFSVRLLIKAVISLLSRRISPSSSAAFFSKFSSRSLTLSIRVI